MNVLLDSLASRLTAIDRTLLTYRLAEGSPLGGVLSDVSPWAVVSLMALDDAQHVTLVDQGVLVEVVDMAGPARQSPGVLPNSQRGVAHLQIDHLADSGHRRIGYALPSDPRLRQFAMPRRSGVREALDRPLPHRSPSCPDTNLRSIGSDPRDGRAHTDVSHAFVTSGLISKFTCGSMCRSTWLPALPSQEIENPHADPHTDLHAIRTVVHMKEARISATEPRRALGQPSGVHSPRSTSAAVRVLADGFRDRETTRAMDDAGAGARGASGSAKLAQPQEPASPSACGSSGAAKLAAPTRG